jgi:DNA-binding GntR family transcriptional regulator
MSAPLKHRTLSAMIADQLRQSILDGTHPAGAQLRQDALGEAYGVSRIPVREALFQLEAEGLREDRAAKRGHRLRTVAR